MKNETRNMKEKMNKVLESFKDDLSRVRTGKATSGLLNNIVVDYYGSKMPVNQLANIKVPDARLILVQPWDKASMDAIKKAIQASDLGISPVVESDSIKLVLPPPTEERRKELVKQVKHKAEERRVSLRNIRRDTKEAIKELQKEKKISEDEEFNGYDEIQKMLDFSIKEIDRIEREKEKEILEF